MQKKYQIFISSTYEDLKVERTKVRDAILSMFHFPVGMELFGAANEEQWEIIRETIDTSDFYVLIIGQRYGTVIETGPDAGISYTEKEFKYALEKGVPTLAFIIDDNVPVKPEYVEKEHVKEFADFKASVKKGRTVVWWQNPDDLAQKVTSAIHNQIQRTDRMGWIRTPLIKTAEYQGVNEWGLERIFKTRAEKNAESDIILEKHSIKKLDGIAFGLRSFRTNREKDLLECLKNGTTVRLLVMDPKSPFLVYKAYEEHVAPESMIKSIIDLTDWVKRLNNQSNNGKITLKYYNAMTLDFYWRVDDSLYVGPYWYGTESQQTITYKFISGGRGFTIYSDYFEKLWNDEKLTREA